MVGKTLRSYRIEDKLGAGGMGIVYRAMDTRLDRPVAIKVLPSAALSSADRQRRFVQEAKAASALNHPHIVTIYEIDTEQVDGAPVQYIAMEFVPGETLDRLIGHKGLRVREALKYAVQMADALAAAHAAGIVHRDLKPSNVMVTPQGLVKLLDFGLAKLAEPPDADPYAATLHAEAGPLTEEGTVLGTVAYMSPEQAEGTKLDARTDIFSFGSVLYEMMSGRQAFVGRSKLSTMSAILHQDPQPLSEAVPGLPPELDKIVSRCMKKDPERRWQSMADLKVALEELLDELESSQVSMQRPRVRKPVFTAARRRVAAGVLAGLVLGLAPAAYLARRFLHTAPATFQRLTFRRGDILSAKLGPDGNVIYGAEWDGTPATLYSVRPGDRESRPLGLPNGKVLSISRSGEMLLLLGDVVSEGTLARAPLSGGTPREVLENVAGADWGADGESIAVVRAVDGNYRVEYPIGTVLYRSEGRAPLSPTVSPDGKLVAFLDFDPEVGDYNLSVIGKDHPKQVLSTGWRAAGRLSWSPGGGEIWLSGGRPGADPGLYAVDMSGRLRLVSQVAGRIYLLDRSRDGGLLISSVNSRIGILFIPPDGSGVRDLAWMDASMPYELSDDGKLLLFMELSYGEGRNAAIYVRKTDGSPAVMLGWGSRPALSPDGKWVACIRHEQARSDVVLLPTGPGESRTAGAEGMRYESVEWFPDGKHVLIVGAEAGKAVRSWMAGVEDGKPRPLTPEGVRATRISPDGLSYLIAAPGKLWLGSIAGGTRKPFCDLEAGESPVRWSGDGRYLFLRQAERREMRISRMALATGRKEPWRVVKVPEIGAVFYGRMAMSADGKALACSFQHDIADLYLVKGLK